MFEKQPVPVCLGDVIELDYLVPESRAVRDINLQIRLFLLCVFSGKLLLCSQTGLGLGLSGFRSHPYPFEFPFEGLAPFALLLLLLCKSR